jgi:hypothetical protein
MPAAKLSAPAYRKNVMSALGLGRVKTLIAGLGRLASRRRLPEAHFEHLSRSAGKPDALPVVFGPFKSEGQRLAHAPIAAISDLTPTMFITRVRL